MVLGGKEPQFYWLPFGVGTTCQRFTLNAKPFQINQYGLSDKHSGDPFFVDEPSADVSIYVLIKPL